MASTRCTRWLGGLAIGVAVSVAGASDDSPKWMAVAVLRASVHALPRIEFALPSR